MTDTISTPVKHATNVTSSGKAKAKRQLERLHVSTQQERKSLKIQGSIAANASPVDEGKFPLFTPFVVSQESSEVYIKLDRHTITSLFSGQRYSGAGINGYLVNFA